MEDLLLLGLLVVTGIDECLEALAVAVTQIVHPLEAVPAVICAA